MPSISLIDRTWPNVCSTHPPIWWAEDLSGGTHALIEPMNIIRQLKMSNVLLSVGFKEIDLGFTLASRTEFDFLLQLIVADLNPLDVNMQFLALTHEDLIRQTFQIVLSDRLFKDRRTETSAGKFGITAGPDFLDGYLFGNEERTENLDLVNVAPNICSQNVELRFDFSDVDEVWSWARLCNQLPVYPRHAYAGDLVHTSFLGLHQDAVKKAFAKRCETDMWDMPCLPIDPKDIRRSCEAVIRVNSQSGKAGIFYILEREHGLELPGRLETDFSQCVKEVMDATGKVLAAQNSYELFLQKYGPLAVKTSSKKLFTHHIRGNDSEPKLVIMGADVATPGRQLCVDSTRNRPIVALVGGLSLATDQTLRVLNYHEYAIGKDACVQVVAYLEFRLELQTFFNVGMDENVMSASLKDILSGLQHAEIQPTNYLQIEENTPMEQI